MDEGKRAIIEYKEIPVEGKPIKFKTVIESAKDANDARAKFWATHIWQAAFTAGILIVSITCGRRPVSKYESKILRHQTL